MRTDHIYNRIGLILEFEHDECPIPNWTDRSYSIFKTITLGPTRKILLDYNLKYETHDI